MKPIIKPISRALLRSELKSEYFLRTTNHAGNEIYVFTAAECPNVMKEIGRLREWAFRSAGGGTGESVDIDAEDLAEGGYKQLVVWDPAANEIVGGYRLIVCEREDEPYLSTEHYFRFSDKFRKEYLPHTIELGRSFVSPAYQDVRKTPKGLYALDNIWDALGAIIVHYPNKKYFFGKVTMYGHYNVEARNMLMYFLHKYFPDKDNLLEPINPVEMNIDYESMERIFCGADYNDDLKILNRELRERGEFIPPMINSYMKVSSTMRVFSTVTNPDFGDVEETGILVTIADMYPNKIERHTKGIEHNVGMFKRFRENARLAIDKAREYTAPVMKVALRNRKAERISRKKNETPK